MSSTSNETAAILALTLIASVYKLAVSHGFLHNKTPPPSYRHSLNKANDWSGYILTGLKAGLWQELFKVDPGCLARLKKKMRVSKYWNAVCFRDIIRSKGQTGIPLSEIPAPPHFKLTPSESCRWKGALSERRLVMSADYQPRTSLKTAAVADAHRNSLHVTAISASSKVGAV